jgi:hypothetical protein
VIRKLQRTTDPLFCRQGSAWTGRAGATHYNPLEGLTVGALPAGWPQRRGRRGLGRSGAVGIPPRPRPDPSSVRKRRLMDGTLGAIRAVIAPSGIPRAGNPPSSEPKVRFSLHLGHSSPRKSTTWGNAAHDRRRRFQALAAAALASIADIGRRFERRRVQRALAVVRHDAEAAQQAAAALKLQMRPERRGVTGRAAWPGIGRQHADASLRISNPH